MKIYLSGSLRNPKIPTTANAIEGQFEDVEVFCDWFGAGKIADDSWQEYEQERGRSYIEALRGPAAMTIFNFDRYHLDSSDGFVLVLPAGKASMLEMGYMIGCGKPTWIYMPAEPERWDQMLQFATGIYDNLNDIVGAIGDFRDDQR